MFNMQMTNALSAENQQTDYKALVCVFLGGGNDSFNMLVPVGDEYADYKTTREDVALNWNDPDNPGATEPQPGDDPLLDLNVLDSNGRQFAVHPALSNVHSLFNAGNAAFIANVGTLVHPMTVANYQAGDIIVPRALFSHIDQITQWQTSVPDQLSSTGWTGRMADVLQSAYPTNQIAMNISLSGNNIMQTGGTTTHYSISRNGSIAFESKNGGPNGSDVRKERHFRHSLIGAVDPDVTSLLSSAYQNLFEETYLDSMRSSIDRDEFFATHFEGAEAAFAGDPSILAAFDDENPLALQLKAIALTIAARGTTALDMKRQSFFVIHGGYDTHQELIGTQDGLLTLLDDALGAFWNALVHLGVQDEVLTFTASDFGRTMRSNGRGTDHAWAGNQIVLGGTPLRGGRIHGSNRNSGDPYPSMGEMTLGGTLDVGQGRLLPTTAVDEFMAELALWFGVGSGDLATVFPNIGNFYATSRAAGGYDSLSYQQLPVGFLTGGQTTPTSVVSLKGQSAENGSLQMTRTGLLFGTGLAATSALIALRERARRLKRGE